MSCREQEKEITVQSIAISQPSAELQIGETLLLKASVVPSNANFNGLNWTSTVPQVASVSSSGLVTALSEGTTIITVMAGGKTASCNIKVLKGTIAVSSISLDKSSLEMVEGETATLTASVSPADATDKTLTWNSSNTSIATVDDSGKVTAVKEGTATITAKAGDKTAQCVVNVQKQSGGIEAVDLGLSVKWASCNVGASMPEEYGDYFAWGETEPYYSSLNPMTWMNGKEKGYLWSSYKWCMGLMRTLTKYCNDLASGYNGFTDTRTVLDLDDDAAYVNLGEKWRIPTDAEWTEIREKCTWTWTRQNGVLGYKVIGPSGKYIFLPEAGFLSSTILYEVGSRGCYWSSSLNVDDSNSAWYLLFFNSDDVKRSYDIRYNGLSVRPVFGDPRSESVPVSGISLNMTELTLEMGQSATLTATVSPSNATDKTVTWTSSNTTVATVSSNGTVTAKAVGTATIAAQAGDKTASCVITVKSSIIEVTSIVLDRTSITLKEGESATLVATVKPDNATDKTIVWKSSDEGTATVDANGRVSGVHIGTAVVSASAGGKTAQCSISVTSGDSGNNNEYLSFVSLDPTGYISYKTNDSGIRIEYSYDTQNWETWKSSLSVALNPGTKLYVRGGNWKKTTTFTFNMTGRVAASGNFMSLLYADDFADRKSFDKNYQLSSVFKGNTNLVEAPTLPATSLYSECYMDFYSGCTNLVKVPDLPATELADRCYQNMFAHCTSLITAPNLSAEKLASYCCRLMFFGCTNLSQAPSLPATDLTGGDSCYSEMFIDCTSLKMAPTLPATTLASRCYSGMFGRCTGLDRAPDLPATKLAGSCYSGMFSDCVNLVHAPSLPATEMAESCYALMFDHCERLKVPPSLPALTLAKDCYGGMFRQCTSLTNAPELPATTLSESCYDLMFSGCYGLTKAPVLPATSLAVGCYRGMFSYCRSLVQSPALPATSLEVDCYAEMFMSCTGLTSAPELPATTLSYGCYRFIFAGCDGLTKAPVLPATSLAVGCYSGMFSSCTSLVQAPTLPATTLASGCYSGMFSGCTSLTNAPELPATTLAAECYKNMFSNCQHLIQAPELPSLTLVTDCYAGMFYRCEKVDYVKMMAVNIPNKSFLSLWLDGTAKQGTFIKNASATWAEKDIIPSGWTVKTATN